MTQKLNCNPLCLKILKNFFTSGGVPDPPHFSLTHYYEEKLLQNKNNNVLHTKYSL